MMIHMDTNGRLSGKGLIYRWDKYGQVGLVTEKGNQEHPKLRRLLLQSSWLDFPLIHPDVHPNKYSYTYWEVEHVFEKQIWQNAKILHALLVEIY